LASSVGGDRGVALSPAGRDRERQAVTGA
jgi:hypothetical protein